MWGLSEWGQIKSTLSVDMYLSTFCQSKFWTLQKNVDPTNSWNRFQVEEGKGGDRHPYLREHNIQSYLIIPPDDTHGVGGEAAAFLLSKAQPKNSLVTPLPQI
jgi:hypothetical protein